MKLVFWISRKVLAELWNKIKSRFDPYRSQHSMQRLSFRCQNVWQCNQSLANKYVQVPMSCNWQMAGESLIKKCPEKCVVLNLGQGGRYKNCLNVHIEFWCMGETLPQMEQTSSMIYAWRQKMAAVIFLTPGKLDIVHTLNLWVIIAPPPLHVFNQSRLIYLANSNIYLGWQLFFSVDCELYQFIGFD